MAAAVSNPLGYRCPSCSRLAVPDNEFAVPVRPSPGVIWWCCDDECAAISGYPVAQAE